MIYRTLNDNQDIYEFQIKSEICDILNLYLNFKHDFLLNNLKTKFKELIEKNSRELYNKMKKGD
jgi:hypothetical protein